MLGVPAQAAMCKCTGMIALVVAAAPSVCAAGVTPDEYVCSVWCIAGVAKSVSMHCRAPLSALTPFNSMQRPQCLQPTMIAQRCMRGVQGKVVNELEIQAAIFALVPTGG